MTMNQIILIWLSSLNKLYAMSMPLIDNEPDDDLEEFIEQTIYWSG